MEPDVLAKEIEGESAKEADFEIVKHDNALEEEGN